jgi:hypothetical protein
MADLPVAAGDDLKIYLPLLGRMLNECAAERFNQDGGFSLPILLFLRDRLQALPQNEVAETLSLLQGVIDDRVIVFRNTTGDVPVPAVGLPIRTVLLAVLSAMSELEKFNLSRADLSTIKKVLHPEASFLARLKEWFNENLARLWSVIFVGTYLAVFIPQSEPISRGISWEMQLFLSIAVTAINAALQYCALSGSNTVKMEVRMLRTQILTLTARVERSEAHLQFLREEVQLLREELPVLRSLVARTPPPERMESDHQV